MKKKYSKRKFTNVSNEELIDILSAHFSDMSWCEDYRIVRVDTTHRGGAVANWIHKDLFMRVVE
jgi:hypothetical protein